MKNNKGFTLVELLVVMVIMGIIIGLSFPAIRKLQEKNMEKKFTTYQESLKMAAKLYTDSYEEDIFGRKENGCACISFSELKDKKLAKDITVKDVSCATDNTFVRITKIADAYTYVSYVGCKEKDNKVDIIYPKQDKAHTMVSAGCDTLCNEKVSNGIYVSVSPNKSTSYSNKKTTYVKVESITGINQGIEMFYAWSTSDTGSEDLTNYKRVRITAPANQKDLIETEGSVNVKSTGISTPSKKSGSYYLHVRIDRLDDLYDSSWKQDNGSKYIVAGPFNIDNEPPKVNTYSIKSTNDSYNAIDPVLNIDATDNITEKENIEFCLSVEKGMNNYYMFHKNGGVASLGTSGDHFCKPELLNENSNRSQYYGKITKDMTPPAIKLYQNKEILYPIYFNVIDEVGNSTTIKTTYETSPQYTLTYDSKGGSNCVSTKVVKKNSGKTTWGDLCTPKRDYYTFEGWYTTDNKQITKDIEATGDLIVHAKWRKNKINFNFKLNSGETLTSTTTSTGGETLNWSKDNNGLIYLNGSLRTYSYDYDVSTIDLPDYNNTSYLNISKAGYVGKSNAQWICESGCKTANQTFTHNAINDFKSSNICDISKGDCTVVVKVNWISSKVLIKLNANGGSLNTNNSRYRLSGGKLLYDGSEIIHSINYGENMGSSGLANYNNPNYLNLYNYGYRIPSGYEWNTMADGKGKSYNQNVVYNSRDFCDASQGDCVVTLYANWKYFPIEITNLYNPTGGNWTRANGFSVTLGTNYNNDEVSAWYYSYGDLGITNPGNGGSNSATQWIKYSNSNVNNFTTTPFSAERNQPAYFLVCGKNGKCAKKATNIKIDRTPPRFIGIINRDPGCPDSATPHKRTGSFEDNLSGIDKSTTYYKVNGRTHYSGSPGSGVTYWLEGFCGHLNSGNVAQYHICDVAGNCADGSTGF